MSMKIAKLNRYRLRKEINKMIIFLWLSDKIRVETYVYNVDKCSPAVFPKIKRHNFSSIVKNNREN